MNHRNIIEGVTKRILDQIFVDLSLDRLDDTEYIRDVKAVILGAQDFIQENSGLFDSLEVAHQALYDYAKEKWMDYRIKCQTENKESTAGTDDLFDPEYLYYYYDYIYDRGVYPL